MISLNSRSRKKAMKRCCMAADIIWKTSGHIPILNWYGWLTIPTGHHIEVHIRCGRPVPGEELTELKKTSTSISCFCMNKNINVIPVGSGSSGNCFYIEMNQYRFLIDLGMGYNKVKDALLFNERNIEDVEAIFITHGHNDHTKACQAIGNHTGCKVYADKSAMYPLRSMKNEKTVIEIGKSFEPIEGLKVKSFSVPHDYVKTCGYIFESENTKIGYVTDCGKMNDNIISCISEADLVIIESNHDIEMLKNGPYPKFLQDRILSEYGHLSNDDCAETIDRLYKTGTKNFLLAHISTHNNTPELALKTSLERNKDKDIFIDVCPKEGNKMFSF